MEFWFTKVRFKDMTSWSQLSCSPSALEFIKTGKGTVEGEFPEGSSAN